MTVKIVYHDPVDFSTLMWNDHFISADDDTESPSINMVVPEKCRQKHFNAIRLQTKHNNDDPFRWFHANHQVFRVYITKIEVRVER